MSFERFVELQSMSKVIIKLAPFDHLSDALIGYLKTDEEIRMQGREKAAYVIIPTAMGQNRKIFNWALAEVFGHLPDAMMVVNEDAWIGMTQDQKIALVYHELSHIAQKTTKDGDPIYTEEGQPVLNLVGHDTEEFVSVADRFGAWHDGLTMLRRALDNPRDIAFLEAVREKLS